MVWEYVILAVILWVAGTFVNLAIVTMWLDFVTPRSSIARKILAVAMWIPLAGALFILMAELLSMSTRIARGK